MRKHRDVKSVKMPPPASFKMKHHILTNFYVRLAIDNFQPSSTERAQSPMTLGPLTRLSRDNGSLLPPLRKPVLSWCVRRPH